MGATQSSGGVVLTQVLAWPTSRHRLSRGSSTPAAICTSVSGEDSITFSSASVMPFGSLSSSARQNSTDCSTYHSGKYTWGMKPPWHTIRVTPREDAVSAACKRRFSATCARPPP